MKSGVSDAETFEKENRSRVLKLASHSVVTFDQIARGAADTCEVKHLRSITHAACDRAFECHQHARSEFSRC
jgi:hypothetical protein